MPSGPSYPRRPRGPPRRYASARADHRPDDRPDDCRRPRRRDRGTVAAHQAPDRADRPRVVSDRRDALPARRSAPRRRLPDHDRRGLRARPDRLRVPRPDRPARRWDRPVRRCLGDRGRPDHRLHRDGQDPRDRQGEPRRGRPAGRHQRHAQGRGRRRGPVLSARPGELRDVLHRRQPRHQCRRPVLRQVRPDPRVGPLARGRDGRRDDHPDRRPEHQGRRRLLADAPVRRQPGDARHHHRSDPPSSGRRRRPA